MRTVFLDIETDDLDASLIYCVVTYEESVGFKEWIDNIGLEEYLQDALVVAHNGLSFDFPVLARLWDIHLTMSQMRDTLLLSMMESPAREGGHSLKAWGIRLGHEKAEFNDFTAFTSEMLEYCKQDVTVCKHLYYFLENAMLQFSEKSISDEHRMRIVADRVSNNGFAIDLEEAKKLHRSIQGREYRIEKQCDQLFPPMIEQRYSEKTGKRLKDRVIEFNPSSRQQIADRLCRLGWKPKEFTPTGQAKVDEKTLSACTIPVAAKLAEYFLLQKRSALVLSWINHCTDGRIHCRYRTLGAITNRMSCVSPNLQQVPAVRVEYGEQCRGLFKAAQGYKLLDTDAAGLELRVLAHYMDDEKFTKEVLEGDVHTANQKMAGLDTRDQAKTFIYALLYGAGDAKIGAVVNGSAKDGAKLRASFMSNMPAYKRLSEAVIRKGENEGKLKGIDGRIIRVRSGHASLNTLIQGSSAVLMKKWFMYVDHHLRRRKLDSKIIAMIHDELVIETIEKDIDLCKESVILSISQVNKAYNLRCKLDCDVQIGNNWSEIH